MLIMYTKLVLQYLSITLTIWLPYILVRLGSRFHKVRQLHMYRCLNPQRYLSQIAICGQRMCNVRSSSIIEAVEASEMETEIGFLNRQV